MIEWYKIKAEWNEVEDGTNEYVNKRDKPLFEKSRKKGNRGV